MYSSDYNQILPNLYIGNERSARNYGDRFNLVVNCTPTIPFHINARNKIRISVDDDPAESANMYRELYQSNALSYMHESLENNRPVLVHCHAGMQRSCAVVACYLINYYGLDPYTAVEYIKQKRPVAFLGGVNFKDTIMGYWNSLHNY